MGVRVYTYAMPITSTSTFSLSTIQRVVIDCAALASGRSATDELGELLGWVRSVPQRSAVHVTLRHATANATGRRLKSIFQALGCTVTMQTAF